MAIKDGLDSKPLAKWALVVTTPRKTTNPPFGQLFSLTPRGAVTSLAPEPFNSTDDFAYQKERQIRRRRRYVRPLVRFAQFPLNSCSIWTQIRPTRLLQIFAGAVSVAVRPRDTPNADRQLVVWPRVGTVTKLYHADEFDSAKFGYSAPVRSAKTCFATEESCLFAEMSFAYRQQTFVSPFGTSSVWNFATVLRYFLSQKGQFSLDPTETFVFSWIRHFYLANRPSATTWVVELHIKRVEKTWYKFT